MIVMFFLSATLFRCGLYGVVESLLIPKTLVNSLNSFDVNSPPLSDRKNIDLLLCVVFDQGFEFLELAEYFIFVLHELNPCLPRKVINKKNIVYIPT